MPELELVVQTQLAQTIQQLQKLEDELKTVATTAQKIEPAANNATKALAKAGVAAAASGDRIAKGTDKAGLALLDFSRIVQDAPYVALSGNFSAIANNINPLVESFGRLKTQTGSVGSALATMGKSLIGPAGLGLAFSVVSSALVLFGDKLFKSSKAADEARKSFEGLLDGIARESLKLRENFAIVADANIPLENRKKVIDNLRSSYGAYLKNVSDEALLTGRAAEAYNKINEALLRKLQLQALEEKIVPLLKQQFDLQTQLNDETQKFNDIRKFVDATAGSNIAKIQKDNAVAIQNSNVSLGKQYSIGQQIAAVGKQIDQIFSNIKPLLVFQDVSIQGIKPKDVKDKIERSLFRTADFGITFIPFPIEIKPIVDPGALANNGTLKIIQSEFDKLAASLKEFDITLPTLATGSIDKGVTALKELYEVGKQLNDNFGTTIPTALLATASSLEEAARRAKAFNQLQIELSQVTQQLAADLAYTFGEALGEALAGGSVKGLFSKLFATLAEGIKAFGKALIQYGTYLAIAQRAFRINNPVLAIAAGIALQALGTFVQSKIPKLATGGIVPPGYPNDSYPAFLTSGETVVPAGKLDGLLRSSSEPLIYIVNGRVRGGDLDLVAERYTKTKRNTR